MTLLALALGWTLWCLGEILACLLWLPVTLSGWLDAGSRWLWHWADVRAADRTIRRARP